MSKRQAYRKRALSRGMVAAVPCVRVPRADGEQARQALAEADLIAETYEITVGDGWLYIPVSDPDAVPADYDVVKRELDRRETDTMPADLLSFDPSYERLGEIVIIDEDDPDRAAATASAVVESSLPVETVVNRASKVKGTERVRDWEVLAGESTETIHREYGCAFELDLATVYFSPRLATERHRVTSPVQAGERFFDMFAGVGPFVVPAAKQGGTAIGVDINADAIEYLGANAARNDVAERVTAIHGDVREVAADYEGWADRIVMNLPHSADEFLATAKELAGETCVVHYYDIQHEDDPYGPGERAICDAVEPDYEATVETRHTVRSYAPHELNVCLDVRLEQQ